MCGSLKMTFDNFDYSSRCYGEWSRLYDSSSWAFVKFYWQGCNIGESSLIMWSMMNHVRRRHRRMLNHEYMYWILWRLLKWLEVKFLLFDLLIILYVMKYRVKIAKDFLRLRKVQDYVTRGKNQSIFLKIENSFF